VELYKDMSVFSYDIIMVDPRWVLPTLFELLTIKNVWVMIISLRGAYVYTLL